MAFPVTKLQLILLLTLGHEKDTWLATLEVAATSCVHLLASELINDVKTRRRLSWELWKFSNLSMVRAYGMVFLWGVKRSKLQLIRSNGRLLGMDWLTKSTHMDKLNCMFVHGSKHLDPNLAALSLATAMIYTILLWLMMKQVCATEMLWLQAYDGQLQSNSRASHSCRSCMTERT